VQAEVLTEEAMLALEDEFVEFLTVPAYELLG
jgi:hypothetical protein